MVLYLMLLSIACNGSPPPEPIDAGNPARTKTTLVDNTMWSFVNASEDPFRAERPTSFACPDWAYVEEFGSLEVDTGACEYLSVQQPALAAVQAGDVVHISLLHDALVADEPGEGHAAISIGDEVIWEAVFPIPSYPNAYSPQVVMATSHPLGAPIVFHLHNHGSNNWRLLSVSLERAH